MNSGAFWTNTIHGPRSASHEWVASGAESPGRFLDRRALAGQLAGRPCHRLRLGALPRSAAAFARYAVLALAPGVPEAVHRPFLDDVARSAGPGAARGAGDRHCPRL